MCRQYRFLKEPGDCRRLLDWWESLEKNRGDRARLRRVERPDDILLTEPFFAFLKRMPETWAEQENLFSSAIIAGVLSHVKGNSDDKTFAAQLASPKEGGDKKKACMSEIRFQQLQKSRDPDEFFRRLLRGIQLAGSRVNILSLAESILNWMNEYQNGLDREPQKRLAILWATDYYTALPK